MNKITCPHCKQEFSLKKRRSKKYTSEEFNMLKEHLLKTWALRGGAYPFTSMDAGILSQLLCYGLNKAKAILDLGRLMIGENEWTKNAHGYTLRGLMTIRAKILDDSRLSSFEKRYEQKIYSCPVLFKQI